MKIIFAFDSFKGSLAADLACTVAAEATAPKNIETILMPMADGGEGTTVALTKALGGTIVNATTHGPLPDKPAQAFFGWCENQRLAVVEMAAASGLTLLQDHERNPLLTTTYGTGELLLHAAHKKPKHIFLGAGGSATVDGGTGVARALGWSFLDAKGHAVPDGGGFLHLISSIIRPDDLDLPPIDVLCDVTNPLTGPHGAAQTFALQKGANYDAVTKLEEGLHHLAGCVKSQLGIDIETQPGGGAAGGLAAGAVVWMNAQLVSGIDRILDLYQFDKVCRDADWIVTGEGKLDDQSLNGKVVSGILARARRTNPSLRIAVIAGKLGLTKETIFGAGIHYAGAITPDNLSFAEACGHAPKLLKAAIDRFITAL